MSDPVRIAVLGNSEFARRRMLPAFHACPDTVLAGVASRDAAAAAETARAWGARAYDCYDAPLEDDEVDAVYVPLPCALHARWAEAALRAGKHVLVEKPAAMSAARTAELCALARAQRLALVENVLFVHHSQHREALRHITDGAVGRLQGFDAAFTVPRRPADDIRHRPELGGGALWDTGVYPVRAALHLLRGTRPRLVGAVSGRGPGDTVDTSGTALFQGGDGLAAQLVYGLDHSYRSTYTFWGTEGRLTVDRAFTPPADHRPVLRLERGGKESLITPAADDQVGNAVAAFAENVRQRAHPDPEMQAQADLLEAIHRFPQTTRHTGTEE